MDRLKESHSAFRLMGEEEVDINEALSNNESNNHFKYELLYALKINNNIKFTLHYEFHVKYWAFINDPGSCLSIQTKNSSMEKCHRFAETV